MATRGVDGAAKVFSILCEICEKNTACVKIPKNETVDSETVCLCSACFQDETVLQGNLLGYYFNGTRCVHHCSDCKLYDVVRLPLHRFLCTASQIWSKPKKLTLQ